MTVDKLMTVTKSMSFSECKGQSVSRDLCAALVFERLKDASVQATCAAACAATSAQCLLQGAQRLVGAEHANASFAPCSWSVAPALEVMLLFIAQADCSAVPADCIACKHAELPSGM